MLSSIVKTLKSYVFSTTDQIQIVAGKRGRDDSDDSEPGELAKRLCTMTERNMSARHRSEATQLHGPSTSKDHEVEVVSQRAAPTAGERRICSPRRSGRRLTDPPPRPPTPPADGRQVPILVERTNRVIPITVERRPSDVKAGEAAPPRPAPAQKGATAATSNGDDDVVVIEQKVKNGSANSRGATPRSDFAGVRSFRQMLETGRVAGRNSPLRRQQQQKQEQRSPKQQTLYDKLMGIAPAKSIKRGISATLNCFRLDEKRRYQQLLSDFAGAGSVHSLSLISEPSFRTRSLLASTSMGRTPAALRRDRLGPASTSELARRVSLVDLVSTGSESNSSAAGRRPPAALPAASAPVVVLSGSEGDSQPTSAVVSDDDSVVVEKVVPAPARKKTQLDEDISRHLKHFAEVRESYAASERERRRRLAEEEQRGAISRLNHAEWERHLAQRLRRQMRVTQRLALPAEEEEEEEEEEDALPELTAEMEGVISAALRPSPPNELMAEAFNQRVTRHDLQTLKSLNWLNDEVINFYMNLVMDRSKTNEKLPKVYCFNTFFYGKIVSQGHSSVKRWTRKVDIFAHDLLLIPVHLGMHWCLACVDLRRKAVRYFDSMLGNNNRGLDAILRYLRDEHADKKKQPLDTSDWQAVNEKEIPQQMNGSDCGVFACKFGEYLSRDARLSFTQEHMPYFRRRMVYEIVNKKLL
ncbi:sentrin-specific protease 1-like isoform X1 [Amphibalanus amphitrite]|uniref:sentrin-specific protease 1-like isoform X1 n=2 Tax=Amphibalanus amphitrite TaxID=1232801 RepID=UPI001C900D3C|nr:sentrin-specific protease 1-like isoform X1 [Amphibalanus amphitrite]XP_043198542.1 sentrin-specific protease 1-like isoform X1 [Amphibalanus amphitrite]XP_043198543.1 sentrin-specific protease 1-like isoform X1 [Amphibalanus amphitrite]XP_043198544.1 sentrin-specific protease 1-like isoform X1 [Amphibalanus amphitrite]XP_043198545.1 sentrin-specific protease 1-like isoform X1 [Amphibalanus amphitrite]XP_043198546.1 sentrin-specific protease 1-like isoform X1 [Amphibalanus amphitrite]XP_04